MDHFSRYGSLDEQDTEQWYNRLLGNQFPGGIYGPADAQAAQSASNWSYFYQQNIAKTRVNNSLVDWKIEFERGWNTFRREAEEAARHKTRIGAIAVISLGLYAILEMWLAYNAF